MEPLSAFGRAWAAIENDLTRWVKGFNPDGYDWEQTVAFADIQATMADLLRALLPFDDQLAREHAVMAALRDFRAAMSIVGIADSGTVLNAAHEAWAKSAGKTQTLIADTHHRAAREEARTLLAEHGFATYLWKSHLDSRTCAYCITMHGREFPIVVPMVSHPNCRCIPVHPFSHLTSGIDWLNERSESTLQRILGPGRVAILNANRDMQPSDFVDEQRPGRLIPVRDYRNQYPMESTRRAMGLPSATKKVGSESSPAAKGKRLGAMDEFKAGSLTVRTTRTKTFPKSWELHFDDPAMSDAQKADIQSKLDQWLPVFFQDLADKTGNGSVWNGRIDIGPDSSDTTGAAGVKLWNCSIWLKPDIFADTRSIYPSSQDFQVPQVTQFGWMETTYHELMHSFSDLAPGYDFASNRYLEEGPVEMLTRAGMSDLANRFGFAAEHLVWTDWKKANHGYTGALNLIDSLAESLNVDTIQLSAVLTQTPMGDRRTLMLDLLESTLTDDKAWNQAMKVLDDLVQGRFSI